MAIKSKPTMINGINPLSYVGVNPYTPPGMYQLPRDPTVRDNAGFQIGDYWMNESTNDLWYLAKKNINGAPDALWILLGKGPSILSLTGDVGGPVFPDANGNINTLGTAGQILVTGTPVNNTLTWSLDGTFATEYPTDIGTAIPAAGVLNVIGGTGIVTEATPNLGNTITISTTNVPAFTSAFGAYISADIPNVTGASAIYQIIFDTAYFNTGGDYDTTTGFYTAPHDGFYSFQTTTSMTDIDASMVTLIGDFVVAGTGPAVGVWSIMRCNPYPLISTGPGVDTWRYNGSITVELAAGDTVSVRVTIGGGAGNTATVSFGSVPPGTVPARTWFTGYNIT